MARMPGEGRRLVHQILGPVLEQPPDDRAVLLDTLTAYVEHGGSAELAAKVLHCHPNTVRYRLRRVHELTRRSLSDPQDIAELATATYALRLSPAARTSPGATRSEQ
jgi:DNA-binding PucR family transcriptional regulator